MKNDSRKSKRITDFLSVGVFVKNRENGATVEGPFTGTIIDFSLDGACILMSQIRREGCHLYHSPKENESLFLKIVVNKPPHLENFTLSASPVWLNTFESDEFQERLIGVRFLEKTDEQKSAAINTIIRDT